MWHIYFILFKIFILFCTSFLFLSISTLFLCRFFVEKLTEIFLNPFLKRPIILLQLLLCFFNLFQMLTTNIDVSHDFKEFRRWHAFWLFMIGFWAFKAFARFCCENCLFCSIAFFTIMRRASKQLHICCRWRILNILNSFSWRICEFILILFLVEARKMIKIVAFGYCTLE